MTNQTLALLGTEQVPAFAADYDEGAIDAARIRKAKFKLRTKNGGWPAALSVGRNVYLKRGQETLFSGVITEPGRRADGRAAVITEVEAEELYARRFQRYPCPGYNEGTTYNATTKRDSEHLNPWGWKEATRDPATLDENGEPKVALGVRIEQAIASIYGFGFTTLMRFDGPKWIRPADLQGSTKSRLVVLADRAHPLALARSRGVSGRYVGPLSVRSQVLRSGNYSLRPSGDVGVVEVALVGECDNTDGASGANAQPTARVCRDGDAGSPTFTSVPLTRTDNYLGTTLTAWVGSVDLSADGAAQKNAVILEVTVNGTANTVETTRIWGARVHARFTAASHPFGLTLGDLDTYVDPTGVPQREFILDNFEDMTVLQAGERCRRSTESTAASNPSPHWDVWWDADGTFHFKQRRGSDLTALVYGDDDTLNGVEVKEDGSMVGYLMYGLGAGEDEDRLLLIDTNAYASGGLYVAANDPSSGAAYGEAGRVLVYKDQSVNSLGELRRRTRAAFKQYQAPQVRVDLDLGPQRSRPQTAGDVVRVRSAKTAVDRLVRVNHVRRENTGSDRERVILEVGDDKNPSVSRGNAAAAASASAREEASSTPRGIQTAVSGPGVAFTKDEYARIPLPVSGGRFLEDFQVILSQLPWQTMATGVASGGGSTSGAGAANLIRPTFGDKTGTTDSTNYGVQSLSNPGTNQAAGQALNSGLTAKSGVLAGSVKYDATIEESITTSFQTIRSFSQAADDDFGFVIVTGWNDSATQHNWEAQITDGTRTIGPQLAMTPINGLTADSVVTTMAIIPVPYSGSVTSWSLQVRSLSGSYSDDYNFNYVAIKTHDHLKGTLAGTNSDISGNSGNKTLSPGLSLDAADLAAFLATTQVGYKGPASGGTGTGTLLYSVGGVDYYSDHTHSVPAHVHDLDYGLFTFRVSGNIVFAQGIEWAIDPTVDALGVPTAWNTEKESLVWGSETIPEEVRVSVMKQLAVDANGVVKDGPHYLYLKVAAATANNPKGLAVVSGAAIPRYKQGAT